MEVPWIVTIEFLEQHQIDFFAHDALPYPDASNIPDVFANFKAHHKFLPTIRTEGISTSELIARCYGLSLELLSKADEEKSSTETKRTLELQKTEYEIRMKKTVR